MLVIKQVLCLYYTKSEEAIFTEMRLFFLFLFLVHYHVLAAEELIRIGLFTASSIKEIEINCVEGNLLLETTTSLSYHTGSVQSVFKCLAVGKEIIVYLNNYEIGTYSNLIVTSSKEGFLFLKPSKPSLKGNHYAGKIYLRAEDGKLKLVNEVPMNEYLTGVLRGEIGFNKPPVVYEVHAIISRTYAKRFGNKHKKEGFNLCDQTHCQVFKGYYNYEPYKYSIDLTEGIVLFDSLNRELAEGLFHSNCGGQTSNSEDVWSSNLNYCRGRIDTFCLKGYHSRWEYSLSKGEFFERLNLDTTLFSCDDICFFSDSRSKELSIGQKTFETITLRNIFKLKSSFFSLECDGDTIYVLGKGYGHGVGLCQEGAIEMAAQCYSAEEIIKYYYNNIQLRAGDLHVP